MPHLGIDPTRRAGSMPAFVVAFLAILFMTVALYLIARGPGGSPMYQWPR